MCVLNLTCARAGCDVHGRHRLPAVETAVPYVAIHIHTSRSHDAIEPNNETCDILVPNNSKMPNI